MPIQAERLEVDVVADTSQAERELDGFVRSTQADVARANAAMDGAGGRGTRMGSQISAGADRASRSGGRMGTAFKVAGGMVAAAAGAMVTALGGKVVMAASDLNENLSKTGVVFGPAKDQVVQAADEMAAAFGMNKNTYLAAASDIGLVAKASGLTRKAAAGLSTDFAGLAADASSFYNVPIEEALEAMKAGLVGESEPMRRFGVLLSEAAVQQEAVRLGIAKTGEELTEGQKVQARSSLIMKGMTDASGDLERTQSSVSNRLREIQGRLMNFAAAMGSKALPAAEWFLAALIKAPGVIKGVADSITNWISNSGMIRPIVDLIVQGVGLLAAGIGKLPGVFATVKAAISGFIQENQWVKDVLDGVVVAVAGFVAGFLAVMAIGKVIAIIKGIAVAIRLMSAAMMANPIGLIVAALVALAAVVYAAYQRFAPFRNLVNQVGAALRQGLGVAIAWVKQQWATHGPAIIAGAMAIKNGLSAMVKFLLPMIRGGFKAMVSVMKTVWNTIKGVVKGAITGIKGVINVVMGIIKGDWGRVWKGIQQIVSGVWNVMKSLVKGAVGVLKTVVMAALNGLKSLWSAGWNAIKSVVSKAWSAIKSAVVSGAAKVVSEAKALPGKVKNGLGNLASFLVSAGSDLVRGLIQGIKNMASSAVSAAKDVVGNAIQGAKDLLGIASPSKVFAEMGKNVVLGLIRGLRRNAKGAWKAAAALANKVVKGWDESIGKGREAFKAYRASLVDWVRETFDGKQQRNMLRSIRRLGEVGRQAMRDQDRINERLKDALARRASLKDQKRSMVDAMREGIASQANVLNAGADATTIKTSLQAQVAKAREFVRNLKGLRDAGFSRAIIAQVAGAGIEGGAEVAKALLGATDKERLSMNKAFKDLNQIAGRQSKMLGQSLYGENIKAADGIIEGLKRKRKAIQERLKRIGDYLADAIRRALGAWDSRKPGGKGKGPRRPGGRPGGGSGRPGGGSISQVRTNPGRIRPMAGVATKVGTLVRGREGRLRLKTGNGIGRVIVGRGGVPKVGGKVARAVASAPLAGTSTARSGDVHFHFATYNPTAEKQSQTTNKALNKVSSLGLV